VVELLLLLEPGEAEELRDRGLLYAGLDCYGLAIRDLEAYLGGGGQAPSGGSAAQPRTGVGPPGSSDGIPSRREPPDASSLRETLENLRARQARVN